MAPSPSILYTVVMLTVISRGTSSQHQIGTELDKFMASPSSTLLPKKDPPTTGRPSSTEIYSEDVQNDLIPMDGVNKTVRNYDGVRLDITDIFREPSNDGIDSNKTIVECANSSVVNHTDLMFKCNYTLAVEEFDAANELTVLGAVDMVAVAAGICLVSAVIGYFSCVGYRRYLQRKYGNNEMVAQEDVYDTTDLRYFEI